MTGSGVPDDDMPNFPWPARTDVPPVGDAALDAALESDAALGPGADTAPDSAAALRPVAEVLGALRAAPSKAELAGLDRALAAFRSGVGMSAAAAQASSTPRPKAQANSTPRPKAQANSTPRPPRRRTPVASRALLSIKVAAAAAIAGVAALGAASYAGALPATLQRFAHDTIAAPAVKGSHGRGDPATTPGSASASAPVPAATAHQWCTEFRHGDAAHRAAISGRLAAAAGGPGRVAAYCDYVLAHGTAPAGQGSGPVPGPVPGSVPASPPGRAVGRTGSHPPGNAVGRTKNQPPGKAVGHSHGTGGDGGHGGGGGGGHGGDGGHGGSGNSGGSGKGKG
ncbi:MAG: hypothetical protein JO345_17235 [Streptosporangiaceae bacterium]|nr:hypothetical protein [Streptosporangiaceae bacterium]